MKSLMSIGLCLGLAAVAAGAEAVPFGVAREPWNERWGNHRVRLQVAQPADAVQAHLLWRRRDPEPHTKAVWVIEAATGKRLDNVAAVEIHRESGDIVFQAAAAGEYHVYFMPFTVNGQSFPTTVYDKPAPTASEAWLKQHELRPAELPAGRWRSLPQAEVVAFESRREFDRRDPMELIATAAEKERLLAKHPAAYLLFPEDRRFPIRMTRDLPVRWCDSGPTPTFHGEALRNEFFVFQIGVCAARAELSDLAVQFTELRAAGGGPPIPAAALRCFNTGGRDWLGRPLVKSVAVPQGHVQPLWIGIDLPADLAADTYTGSVTVKPANQDPATVSVVLKVAAEALADRGDSQLWRLSRLRWLDSTVGLEDEVTAPYTPLEVAEQTVKCLGRDVVFGASGLPAKIHAGTEDLLARPVEFVVETPQGPIPFQFSTPQVVSRTPARVIVESTGQAPGLKLHSRAVMEFDGYINFQLALQAERDTPLADCRLQIPLRPAFASYLMGMGCKGGARPARWEWKWDQAKHQDAVWIGSVTGGLQCKLKGPDYRWPLVNIHYHRRPLELPEAWHNSGRGGCVIAPAGADTVLLSAYGGPRTLAAGKSLRFDFGLLITPVKPLDYRAHWTQRYYHGGVPAPADVARQGAKIINIHHGNDLNPFINYPFLTTDKLADYARTAHEQGLKFKLYYTIRELSNHVAELWALRSLGDEIYADGPGGGYAWLHEHLVDHYSPAWHQPLPDTWCASISQTGLSRWHNYYIEGLGWLARNVQLDGLYLDEIGYDREIMKRVRRVLDQNRPGSLLDLHSWNHFNGMAGYANCLNLYLEHLPYLDSLWIGEGRDYDEPPEHWLVEVSGLPFGLFSEMLEGGGNPWRGMLYGMTNRLPWSGAPQALWKLWDEFGIQDAEMLGYWSPACPVKTDQEQVLATVYRKPGQALICLATWNKAPVTCRLQLDWKALGLDPARTTLAAPAIAGLQEPRQLALSEPLPIAPRKGWLLVLREKP